MMYENIEQITKVIVEREKVKVPVRRREAEKEAEREIEAEPRLAKQWIIPRRWYNY